MLVSCSQEHLPISSNKFKKCSSSSPSQHFSENEYPLKCSGNILLIFLKHFRYPLKYLGRIPLNYSSIISNYFSGLINEQFEVYLFKQKNVQKFSRRKKNNRIFYGFYVFNCSYSKIKLQSANNMHK